MHTPLQPTDTPTARASKTRRKQSMDRHQQLGELLLGLKPKSWETLPIQESLLAALREDARIRAQEAKRRHRQYIGKLMRHQDLDLLLEHLNTILPAPGKSIPLETIVERLIQGGDKAIQETLQRIPGCDRSYLRELVSALIEAQAQTPEQIQDANHQLRQYLSEAQILNRF